METIHCFQKTRHLQTSLFTSLYRALSLRSPFFYQKLFADLFVLFPTYLLIPQKHKCTHFAHKAGASAKRQLHRRVKSVTECKLLSRLMPRYGGRPYITYTLREGGWVAMGCTLMYCGGWMGSARMYVLIMYKEFPV